MIYHLLQAITTTLQFELKGQGLDAKRQWGFAPVADPAKLTLPYIALYPSKLHASQALQQEPYHSSPDSPVRLTTTQEFQQDFTIDLYDKALGSLEKISSLVVGSLLTNHDTLVESYNISTKAELKPEYRANQLFTRHHLRQFQFLYGTPTFPTNSVGLQLAFTAIGYLTLTKILTEDLSRIQTIHLSTPNSPDG